MGWLIFATPRKNFQRTVLRVEVQSQGDCSVAPFEQLSGNAKTKGRDNTLVATTREGEKFPCGQMSLRALWQRKCSVYWKIFCYQLTSRCENALQCSKMLALGEIGKRGHMFFVLFCFLGGTISYNCTWSYNYLKRLMRRQAATTACCYMRTHCNNRQTGMWTTCRWAHSMCI